jgi:hypothetical protein
VRSWAGMPPWPTTGIYYLPRLDIACLGVLKSLGMATAMKYRDVERALLASNCTWKPGKGDHIKWYCPCGKHIAVVTQARTVSAGVVADTVTKLACLPAGWLQ